ncbi:MAG: hypothetical protein EHM79_00300 [Geobacter sp.]|nr:MAG: hypothetical protein EHM79_00300 [Geobacter sp.]
MTYKELSIKLSEFLESKGLSDMEIPVIQPSGEVQEPYLRIINIHDVEKDQHHLISICLKSWKFK